MNIYSEVGSNLQQIGGDKPAGWIEMQSERPNNEMSLDYTSQSDGTWGVTEETLLAKLVSSESQWREDQMAEVAYQLLMIEDEDPKAKIGTSRQWKDYRIELRSWTESNPNFPDSSKRPVAPG